ncbi:MAG: hypothetical protein K2P68_04300 [Sphingomonas sp.]|nr:hypothetical protein [Sphingomonas sp.]
MKIVLAIFIPIAALALILTLWDLRPAYRHSNQDWAKGCDARVADFRAARAKAMSEMTGTKRVIGRCALEKNDAGGLKLEVLEPGYVASNAQTL